MSPYCKLVKSLFRVYTNLNRTAFYAIIFIIFIFNLHAVCIKTLFIMKKLLYIKTEKINEYIDINKMSQLHNI